MWWRKFKIYAKVSYGVDVTDREAQHSREVFFSLYPGLVEWHELVKEYAHKHKMVRSFTGRIRHLPAVDSPIEWIVKKAEREGVNAVVQETGSSLGLIAGAAIHETIDDKYFAPNGFIHDWFGGYVQQKHVLWAARTIKDYMQSVPMEEYFGVKFKCPIVADASFGPNMGDDYELENLTMEGDYDFSQFWYDENDPAQAEGRELPPLYVPPQEVPPNDGKRVKPYYDVV